MRAQSTLVRRVRLSGIGLHTGRHVRVVLHPARADHGVVFYRSDVDAFLPAVAEAAGRFDHATSLGERGHDVATVEHLLPAPVGAGLDNLLVELDGPEVPILDGSALPWLDAFETAGLVALNARAVPFVPSRVLAVSASGGRKLEIRPARDLRVTYTIDFSNAVVGRQSITVVVTPESYAAHIAPARTFGFLAEYEMLKAHGLARGAREDNCIVVGDDRVENGDLRFADEFVRHKALDLLGDLARLLREESRAAFAAPVPAHTAARTSRI